MTTKLLNSLAAATTLAGMMVTAGVANAASLTRTVSTEFARTNITNKVLSIEKFDPSLGTLTSVYLDFTGDLTGNAAFENTGDGPDTITVRLSAVIDLTSNDVVITDIFPFTPVLEESYEVGVFDGDEDFSGTSGERVAGLEASGSADKTFAGNLAAFIGPGNLDFLFSATAQSSVSGETGNITSSVRTFAKANLSLTYNYDDGLRTVPEPSALLGIGLFAGIGVLSQRKKSWFKISHC